MEDKVIVDGLTFITLYYKRPITPTEVERIAAELRKERFRKRGHACTHRIQRFIFAPPTSFREAGLNDASISFRVSRYASYTACPSTGK